MKRMFVASRGVYGHYNHFFGLRNPLFTARMPFNTGSDLLLEGGFSILMILISFWLICVCLYTGWFRSCRARIRIFDRLKHVSIKFGYNSGESWRSFGDRMFPFTYVT